MGKFNNSAQRILSHVQKISKANEKETASEVWGQAFGLDKKKCKADPHEIAGKLSLLREELDLVQRYMEGTKFSKELWKPYLEKIQKTITIVHYNAQWNQYKQLLTDDAVLALKYCAEILPREPEISLEELESIIAKINELRSEIENGSVSEPTYSFILGQLDILERAVKNYPIKGSESIKAAYREAVTDVIDKEEILKGSEDVESTSKLKSVWKDFSAASSKFVEVDKFANAYVGLTEKGSAISESVGNLLS